MKIEECKKGMRVKINDTVVDDLNGMIGRIHFIRRNYNGCDVLLDGKGLERIDGTYGKLFSCIPCKKLTPYKVSLDDIIRLQRSKHVQDLFRKLRAYYGIKKYRIQYDIHTDGLINMEWVKEQPDGLITLEASVHAKCHPHDKFNINTGLRLAVSRMAEKIKAINDNNASSIFDMTKEEFEKGIDKVMAEIEKEDAQGKRKDDIRDAVKEMWDSCIAQEEKGRANQQHDNVNHPSHYQLDGGMETIDIIKAVTGKEYRGYAKGNIVKYVARYEKKNGVEDLKKTRWYLDDLIEWEQEHGEKQG